MSAKLVINLATSIINIAGPDEGPLLNFTLQHQLDSVCSYSLHMKLMSFVNHMCNTTLCHLLQRGSVGGCIWDLLKVPKFRSEVYTFHLSSCVRHPVESASLIVSYRYLCVTLCVLHCTASDFFAICSVMQQLAWLPQTHHGHHPFQYFIFSDWAA